MGKNWCKELQKIYSSHDTTYGACIQIVIPEYHVFMAMLMTLNYDSLPAFAFPPAIEPG